MKKRILTALCCICLLSAGRAHAQWVVTDPGNLAQGITEIYVTSYERMLSDPYFTPEELSAIALGYTKLLEESANLLTDLKTVVNENGLSMNDKERMDIIDRCYTDMLQYRSLVQYYTNKNIGVSYLRAKKQNDLDRVMALYGSPNERYW